MKTCPNCKVEVEDHFELCWNCNYSFEEHGVMEIKDERETHLFCLRCKTPLFFYGNYNFREGNLVGTLKEFDLFACPSCGKIEFYLPVQKLKKYQREI